MKLELEGTSFDFVVTNIKKKKSNNNKHPNIYVVHCVLY